MYIRRFYYDLASGQTVLSYMRQGDVLAGSAAEDFRTCPELSGRSAGDTGLFEWTELIPETESQFSNASQVSVENGALKFVAMEPAPTVEERIQAAIDAYTLELVEGGLL